MPIQCMPIIVGWILVGGIYCFTSLMTLKFFLVLSYFRVFLILWILFEVEIRSLYFEVKLLIVL